MKECWNFTKFLAQGRPAQQLCLTGTLQVIIAIVINGFISQRLQNLVEHLKVWAVEGLNLGIVYQQEVSVDVVCKSSVLLAPAFL